MTRPDQKNGQGHRRAQQDIKGIVIPSHNGRHGYPYGDCQKDQARDRHQPQQHQRRRQRGGNMRAGERDRLDAPMVQKPVVEHAPLGNHLFAGNDAGWQGREKRGDGIAGIS